MSSTPPIGKDRLDPADPRLDLPHALCSVGRHADLHCTPAVASAGGLGATAVLGSHIHLLRIELPQTGPQRPEFGQQILRRTVLIPVVALLVDFGLQLIQPLSQLGPLGERIFRKLIETPPHLGDLTEHPIQVPAHLIHIIDATTGRMH